MSLTLRGALLGSQCVEVQMEGKLVSGCTRQKEGMHMHIDISTHHTSTRPGEQSPTPQALRINSNSSRRTLEAVIARALAVVILSSTTFNLCISASISPLCSSGGGGPRRTAGDSDLVVVRKLLSTSPDSAAIKPERRGTPKIEGTA